MSRVYQVFKIKPGEERMAILLAGLMLFSAVGSAVGGNATEALFFARFGVTLLPVMYIILGLFTFITTMAISALMGRVAKQRLYVMLPFLLGLALVGERLVVLLNLRWFFAVMWLGMNVISSLLGLATWGLAGAACDTRQAKRLFPLFSAGGILGTVFGGLVTQFLAGWLHSENLLLVWAGTLIISFLLSRALAGRTPVVSRLPHAEGLGFLEEVQRGYQFVRRSPIMRWISYSAILFSVCYYSLALPFSRGVTAQFPDADRLAGFLGSFQGLYTAAALLASLFLANRTFARFGIMPMLLIFPAIYLAGFGLLAVYAPFIMLVAVRFTQMAYMNGIAETAWQASLNVVPPDVRDQVRAFINGVPSQAGTFIAGLVLVIGEQALQPQQLYLIGFVAAAFLVYIIWRAGRAYAGALVEALRAGQPQVFFREGWSFGSFQSDAAAVSVALRGLRDPEAGVRRVAAEIVGHLPSSEASVGLIEALGDDDPQVRAEALSGLARSRATLSPDVINACLSDPVPEVRLAAIDTLSQLAAAQHASAAQLEPLLKDDDPQVRAQAARILVQVWSHAGARETLHAMVIDTDLQARTCALAALGECVDKTAFGLVAEALDDKLPLVRQAAFKSLVALNPIEALPHLVRHLDEDDASVCHALAESLGTVGEPALEPLAAALNSLATENAALMALEFLPAHKIGPKIRSYATVTARAALRYHQLALGAAQVFRLQADDDGSIRLLIDSLHDRAIRSGLNALRALGLVAEHETVQAAVDNLRSRDAAQRANALETLEAVGERETIHPLLALWESGEKSPPQLPDGWLGDLLDDPDAWLRACAVMVAVKDGGNLRHKFETICRSDPDSFVRALAGNVLKGGAAMDTLATLSLMERILFLRRVPLFDRLSPADLKQVAAIAREVLFSDGQVLASQGEMGMEMYILVSGEVQVLVAPGAGKEPRQVARRRSGDAVGEMSVINQEPRIATLIADGAVRALCIEQKQFEGILRERPETSLALIRTLSQRLKEAEER